MAKDKFKFKFDLGIDNEPVEIDEDDDITEYDKRKRKIIGIYADFIKEDLMQLGVSKDEASSIAEAFKESELNPPDDEDDED